MDTKPSNNYKVWQPFFEAFIPFVFVLILAGCASQIVNPPAQNANALINTSSNLDTFTNYHLRNGDVLEIIYQIQPKPIAAYHLNIQDVVELRYVSLPHMNQEQVIRADGLLTVPLVGDIKVLGMTPANATKLIRNKYKDILRDPDVYLVVKEYGAATKELKKVITTNSRGQSKLLTIRPDGAVTFPIIGEINVVGKQITHITRLVNKRYQKLYPELQVDVILFKAADQFVYVLGEVGRPGAFEIRRPMSIGQALALAGGTNQRSRITNIVLARHAGEALLIQKIDYKAALEGRGTAIHAFLRPDDILYVPRRSLSSNAQISREIANLMLFGGYSLGFQGN